MTQVPDAPRPPLARRPSFWLALAAGLLLAAIAVVLVVALLAPEGTTDAASTSTPTTAAASTSAPPTTAPAPEPPPEPAPAVVAIPSSCDAIYTRDWSADLAPRVLNPAWIDDPASGFKRWGSNDVGLVTMLEGTTQLECNWVPESGTGHVFLVTSVASLTPEQQGSTLDYLVTTGMDCYDQSGGTRCVVEGDEGGEAWGESHFVREGIWIATRWGGSGPTGYTQDIVTALFG
ncbi:hypothetical protein ACWEOH_12445 [Agromyces sp. NPDC004153]